MSAATQIDWSKYASPQPASQIDFSKYETKKAEPKQEPSAIPSGSDWLHAAGLPSSLEEADLTPKQAMQLGAMNILHAADPTYLFRSVAVPMVKEGGRAAKGIWEHGGIPQDMDLVHSLSAINPFAAPVIDRMSELREQGKEGEATATGLLGAGTLALGEAFPRVAPAARVLKKPLTAVADTLNPDLVGIVSPRAAHILRTIGKVAEALPDSATAKSHPAAQAAVADAFQELKAAAAPTARMVDVPSLQVRPGARAPVNLLERQTSAAALRGSQGEFPVVPPEPSATGRLSEMAGNEPLDPKKFYGKTPTKSNLKSNQRQLASPTGSTAPVPTSASPHPPQIADILNKPGELSDADMDLLKRYDFSKQAWRTGEAPKTAEDEALAGVMREALKQTEQTATAEGRSAQAEAARSGSKYLNPSKAGFGKAPGNVPVEETTEGARMMRERAERDARRKGTLGEMSSPGNLGPGAANITDPAFLEGKALGSHADHLNSLAESNVTGEDVGAFNLVSKHADELAATYGPEEAKQGILGNRIGEHVRNLLEKYKTDPTFKNLADAARVYVHNHQTIGDIDKISLGEQPFHLGAKDLTLEEMEDQAKSTWPVDSRTTLLDGSELGRRTISMHEGQQMVETLYSAIREAKERSAPLYRGISPEPPEVQRLKIGDSFPLALSSFSDRPGVATQFGDTIFELTGPSKHLNVKPFNFHGEGEHLTQGRFEVTGIRTEKVTPSTYFSSKEYPSSSYTRRYITIKQTGVH